MANTIEDIWVQGDGTIRIIYRYGRYNVKCHSQISSYELQDGWFTIAGRYRGFKLEDKKTIRGYFEFLKKLKNEDKRDFEQGQAVGHQG